ncbi:MAG: Lin1244/Lin1753 domain-containing protein [Oscillospiraceae bacterium]
MKSGSDYCPLDVALDSKMELIEAEFGLTGFGVIVKLLGEIYGKQGYYIEWTEEVALLFARKVGLGGGVVSEIVSAAVRRGMFNQAIFNKSRVLTSRGVQKRYFEAVSRRKEIEVDENILLLNPAQFCKNASIKWKNVGIFPENADRTGQSREEERREEQRKAEDGAGSSEAQTNAPGGALGVVMGYYMDKVDAAPSSTCLRELTGFCGKLPPEIVISAIDSALDNKKASWAYIRSILRRCVRDKIMTAADWAADLRGKNHAGKTESAGGGRKWGVTYDVGG